MNRVRAEPGSVVGAAPADLQSADVFSAPGTTFKHNAPLAR